MSTEPDESVPCPVCGADPGVAERVAAAEAMVVELRRQRDKAEQLLAMAAAR